MAYPPNSPVYNPRSLITIKHPKWPTVVLRVCVCLVLCMYMNIAGLPAKCKEASGRDSNHTTNPTCLMVCETTTVGGGKANVVKRQRSQRKFICGKCLRLVVYTIQKCIINMEVTRGVLSICKLTRVITFEYRTDIKRLLRLLPNNHTPCNTLFEYNYSFVSDGNWGEEVEWG